MRGLIPRALRSVWWVSVVWLAFRGAGISYWFVTWLIDKGNPARYEYAIGADIVELYSFPAALGVIAASIVPKAGISHCKEDWRRCIVVVLYLRRDIARLSPASISVARSLEMIHGSQISTNGFR